MQSRSNSISNKADSPSDNSLSSPKSPIAASALSDPASLAAFSNLLPLGSLPVTSSPVAAHGPISGIHKLPPRPRPGRKADPNPAPTKKGQSNRLAQQKHRQKKKQLEAQEIERQRRQAEETNRLLRQNAMLLHENKKLRQTHISPGPLSPALESITSSNTMSLSPQVSSIQTPPRPAPGGCGDCVEGGSCPCVDSLIETGEHDDHMDIDPPALLNSPRRPSPRSQRPSLSIQSLLSPAAELPNPLSAATSPRPVHHEHNLEHEIDFTSAFRNPSHHDAYDPAMPTGSPTTCGGCPPNDASCLCRKANKVVGSDADSDISSAAHSRATSAAANGPGSCARCQADPKQRAWCQGLALETLGSPITSASDNGDHFSDVQSVDVKQARIQYETISCAEAYSVQQRFTDATKRTRRKSSMLLSAVDVLNSVRERPREYSAFEVDIGTVLSNLKHCSPKRPNDAR